MEVTFTDDAKADLKYWKTTNNIKIQQIITELITSIRENPTRGIGKPEALKHNLSGLWSRRINSEHRLIYQPTKENIIIHGLKGHYKK